MYCTFQKVGYCPRRRRNKHQCTNAGCKNVAYTNNPSKDIRGDCWSDRSRPGDKLKAIFRKLGIDKGKGCKCDQHVNLMNSWGAEKCKQEIDTIVGWMEEASKELKLPFNRLLTKTIIRTAIWQAEKEVKNRRS